MLNLSKKWQSIKHYFHHVLSAIKVHRWLSLALTAVILLPHAAVYLSVSGFVWQTVFFIVLSLSAVMTLLLWFVLAVLVGALFSLPFDMKTSAHHSVKWVSILMLMIYSFVDIRLLLDIAGLYSL